MPSPSPTSVGASPFSFYNDSASSPTSSKGSKEKDFPPRRLSDGSSLGPPLSPYPQTVDPSPVDSNGTAGTDTTEIDDAPQDSQGKHRTASPRSQTFSPISPSSQLGKLDTTVTDSPIPDEESNPQSVIHAPPQFKQFSATSTPIKEADTSSPSDHSSHTIMSPASPKDSMSTPSRKDSATSPLKTDLPTAQVIDRSTPRAQTIQEAEEEWKRRKRQTPNLADIPEGANMDAVPEDPGEVTSQEARLVQAIREEHDAQVASLRTALSECWTLCNTLANLSSNHRSRIFAYRGKSEVQEQAWRSCWRLCQDLYENRNEDHAGLILPTLEMCREFCQALFDARQKGDEVADSVLRVSFELNNHLYNTHDRNLPSAFQERTLDFYLTLCHRLMKQRTSLPPETDALLRACWTLAEMLFSIRQNTREGRPEDEELLGSAVQSCWDLCDLFREGWTQVRPSTERGTPRANQTQFSPTGAASSIHSTSMFSSRSSPSLTRSSSTHSYNADPKPFPPETPTTIFEDMNESPLADDANVPNILVLGPEHAGPGAGRSHSHTRWNDSASISGYTESSQRTSSTATAPAQRAATATNLTRIRILLLRAALAAGFTLRAPSPGSGSSAPRTGVITPRTLQQQNQALVAFVKALPPHAFGSAGWQTALVEKYRRFVAAWPAIIRSSVSANAICKGDGDAAEEGDGEVVKVAERIVVAGKSQSRCSAPEIALAVRWMMRKESNGWLADLFRVVFGVLVEESGEGPVVAVVG